MITARLRRVLPAERIITDPSERDLYDSDGLTLRAGRRHRHASRDSTPFRPGGVAIVETRDEAIAVMRALAAEGLPFVPRGAGTGLSGGAVPLAHAWVVDVHRMQRVVAIDGADRYAIVEPGVINLELDTLAAAYGLRYAPDPSSQSVCTIGGNLAENSGGPHCFLHGMTTRHVLGLTMVAPDGRVITLGGAPGRARDADWRGLFIGAEGTFGLIVEATLQLVPRPEETRTYLASFASLRASCEVVARMIAEGLRPAALEILDRLTIHAVEASVFRAGYPREAEAVLLIEQEGAAIECASEAPYIEQACRELGCLSFDEAHDDAERKRLWRGRKGAFGAMGRINRDLYVLDGVVPRKRLPDVIEAIQALGQRHGLQLSNVFHAGDGNLHPNISFDARDPDQVARVLAAGHEILEICVSAGGTLSGEHGIGLEKRDAMPLVFDEDDLDTQRRVRDAIDPDGRANPGKIFPTGHSCVEAGFRSRAQLERVASIIH